MGAATGAALSASSPSDSLVMSSLRGVWEDREYPPWAACAVSSRGRKRERGRGRDRGGREEEAEGKDLGEESLDESLLLVVVVVVKDFLDASPTASGGGAVRVRVSSELLLLTSLSS